jgi:hypothetical protein
LQGAGRGIADTAALPFDVANMGANALLAGIDKAYGATGGDGVSFRFPMTSDEIAKTGSQAASAIGMPVADERDMSPREKAAYNINRYGTQGALTGGLLGYLTSLRASLGAATPSIGDSLLRAYRTNPAATVAGDTAAGAGAGTGITLSQMLPEEVRRAGGGTVGAAADVAAMLAGGVGATTALETATRGPSAVVDKFRGARPASEIPLDNGLPTTNRLADRAAEFVQAQSADPEAAAANIRAGANTFRDMGAPTPTSGMLSGDPKLMAFERGDRNARPGDYAVKDMRLRDAAVDTVAGIQPQNVDARGATNFLQGEVSRRIGEAESGLRWAREQSDAAEAAERSVASNIQSFGGRGSQASADLDQIVSNRALVPSQAEKNRRYREIDPGRTVMRDLEPLAALADDIEREVAEVPAALRREMIPEGLIADIRRMRARQEVDPATGEAINVGGPGEMSFGAMNEMRSGLASASLAARTAGQSRLSENLDRFRALIGQEGHALASEGSEAGQRARAANEYYANEFAPVWNAGPGDAAARFRKDFNVDRANRTTTPPTTTAGRFLSTGAGSTEKAESLSRVIGSLADPSDQAAAIDAVRRYVLDDMSRTVGADGRIRPQQLARWLNGKGGWADALGPFPAVRAEMDQILRDVQVGNASRTSAAAEVERASRSLRRTRDEIDASALSLVIGREPKKAARAVLESADPQMAMREIRHTIGGNALARQAWERAVTDHLIDRVTRVDPAGVSAGSHSLDYGKLVTSFKRYESALAELYVGQSDKMNALRRAQKMLEPLAKVSGPSIKAAPDNSAQEALWRGLEVGLKGVYGVLKGGGLLRTIRIAAGDLGGDAAQIERLVARMMFDPELAAHLLTRKTRDVGSPVYNDKLATLLRRVQAGRTVWGDQE